MIQRIQSIWLLLAAVASFVSLKLTFYSGYKDNNLFEELKGSSDFLLMIVSVAVGLLALITIFLYKNRKLQIQLTWLGIVLQAVVLLLYFQQTKTYVQGNFTLTSVVSFIIPLFFILAWLGVRKDEKLIKSMDRLR